VPGGFLKLDEDALQGLRRELKEELGIEIDVRDEDCVQLATHTYGDEDFHVIAIGFVGRLVSGEPEPADDVSGFSWVAESDLDEVDFAWPHDRELVRRALKRGDG
jgi:8-oxo-dGTP diphosphatase